jgi:ribonuclease P/MRP protein subunit POP5
MKTVPVKNGRMCVFRVVRVSGTIRKAEEEAIRNAREMILRAKREIGEQSATTLDTMLRKHDDTKTWNSDKDILVVDESGSEEEDLSGGDG